LASAKVTTKSFIPFGKHGCQGLGELKKISPFQEIFDNFFLGNYSRGRWGTYGQHFLIFNIMQSLNLELKLNIVFKSWTENLHFLNVTKILKISVRGFFANLILCP
jgi:hypothetical protein